MYIFCLYDRICRLYSSFKLMCDSSLAKCIKCISSPCTKSRHFELRSNFIIFLNFKCYRLSFASCLRFKIDWTKLTNRIIQIFNYFLYYEHEFHSIDKNILIAYSIWTSFWDHCIANQFDTNINSSSFASFHRAGFDLRLFLIFWGEKKIFW